MKRNKIKSRLLSSILTGILISSTAITSFATVPENQVPALEDYPTGQFLVAGDTGGYFLWTVPKSGVYRLVVRGGASSPSTRLIASSFIHMKSIYTGGTSPSNPPWDENKKSWSEYNTSVAPRQGRMEATLLRGQKLHIFVGGDAKFNTINGTVEPAYNGGGSGHTPIPVPADRKWSLAGVKILVPNGINYIQAGAGGGATDIRLSADPSDPSKYLKHLLVSSPSPDKQIIEYRQPTLYIMKYDWNNTGKYYQYFGYYGINYNYAETYFGERLGGSVSAGERKLMEQAAPVVSSYGGTVNLAYAGGTYNNLTTFLNSITPEKYGFSSTVDSSTTVDAVTKPGVMYHNYKDENGYDPITYYDENNQLRWHKHTSGRFGGISNAGISVAASNVGLNRLSGGKDPNAADTIWPTHPNRPGISWAFRTADPSVPDIPIDIPNLVPPQIEVATAPSTAPTKNNLSITLRGSDDATAPSSLEFLTVPGLAAPTITSTSTYKQAVYTFTENGTYTFRVKDAEGNVGTYTYTVSNIDKTPPSVSYKLSTNNPTNGNVFIELDARDNIEVKEIRDASNTKIGDTGASIEVSANGNYSFKAIDTALNERTVTVPVTNIDKTAPTAPTITKVGTNQFTMSAVGDNMTPIDKIKLQYSINGGDWLTYLGTPIDIPEGNYNIRGKAIDNAGNETITTSTGNLEGSYSTEHPTINIIMQQTNPTQEKSKVELRVQTNDTVGIKSINISSPSGSEVLSSVTIPNSETKKITDFRFNLMADKNGIYKVTVEKWGDGVNPGLKSNLDVEVKNIDTANPSVNINESNLQRISSTSTRLSISGSDIYDDLSPASKMKVSVQGTSKWYSLSSTGVTLTHGASDTTLNLVVQDESGRQTNTALNIPSLPSYGGGTGGTGETGDHVGTPNDNLTPKPVNQLEQEIQIPNIGTHYQLSHDNVNWGTWEERGSASNIKVTLPTGDGVKNVYVRTGFAEDKTQAIFNSVTGEVEYAPNGESTVKPLDNTIKTAFVFDLTPPSLILTSRNNTWVADEEGNLNVEVELIDNLDTKPGVKLTLTNYKDELIWESANDLFMPENSTTIRLPVKNLFKDPLDTRQKGFNLRVEGKDKNGNKVVKNQVIYGKFLKP